MEIAIQVIVRGKENPLGRLWVQRGCTFTIGVQLMPRDKMISNRKAWMELNGAT
jgi:hypothetical protein